MVLRVQEPEDSRPLFMARFEIRFTQQVMHARPYEFPDITFMRKVFVLVFWVPVASFVTAVFLVTIFFHLFIPHP